MIVIKTKRIPPTSTEDALIEAYTSCYSVTIPHDYSLCSEELHFKAVQALIEKHNLNWDLNNMRYGSDEMGNHFFCFALSAINCTPVGLIYQNVEIEMKRLAASGAIDNSAEKQGLILKVALENIAHRLGNERNKDVINLRKF